jgi:hypothetical protein
MRGKGNPEYEKNQTHDAGIEDIAAVDAAHGLGNAK